MEIIPDISNTNGEINKIPLLFSSLKPYFINEFVRYKRVFVGLNVIYLTAIFLISLITSAKKNSALLK